VDEVIYNMMTSLPVTDGLSFMSYLISPIRLHSTLKMAAIKKHLYIVSLDSKGYF